MHILRKKSQYISRLSFAKQENFQDGCFTKETHLRDGMQRSMESGREVLMGRKMDYMSCSATRFQAE